MTFEQVNQERIRRGKRPLSRQDFDQHIGGRTNDGSDSFFNELILMEFLDDITSGVVSGFEGAGGSFGGAGASGDFGISDAVVDVASGVLDTAGDALSGVADSLGDAISGIFDS